MIYSNLTVNPAGHLVFAGYDTVELAAEYGTPLMLLDEQAIRARCRVYKAAMAEHLPAGSMPLYASKALSFKRMYEIMKEEGMGIDVVSSGELHTAVRAGFPLERAFFHGNAKTDRDIAYAMDNGMGCFVCDNADELNAIDAEAGRRGIRQKVLLRITPRHRPPHPRQDQHRPGGLQVRRRHRDRSGRGTDLPGAVQGQRGTAGLPLPHRLPDLRARPLL